MPGLREMTWRGVHLRRLGPDASKMRAAADGNAGRCKQTFVRHREELKELYSRLLLQRVEKR
ncbi:MAG: hypothetical protein K2O55_01845, partial [Alistipes sp.]|nr:hypothetical protein [Alistipes sp.]